MQETVIERIIIDAVASVRGTKIDAEEARAVMEVLSDDKTYERKWRGFDPEIVATITGVTVDQMRSKSRKRGLVYARHLMMYFMDKYTYLSLADIGAYLHRNHATVIHAKKNVETLLPQDQSLREQFQKIDVYFSLNLSID